MRLVLRINFLLATKPPPSLSDSQWEMIEGSKSKEYSGKPFYCSEEEVAPGDWPYAVQPYPVHFTQDPVGVVTYDKYLSLRCSVSSMMAYNDLFQPSLHWELNGTAIVPSEVFAIEANSTSSLLTVFMTLQNETEGVYTCFVDDYYFSLQSLPFEVWRSGKFTKSLVVIIIVYWVLLVLYEYW